MHLNIKIIRIHNIRLRFGAIILQNKKIQSITKLTTNTEKRSIFFQIFLLNISHCIHLRCHVSLLKYSIVHVCILEIYDYNLLTKRGYNYYRTTITFVAMDFKFEIKDTHRL